MPPSRGEAGEKVADLSGQRRRIHGLGQDSETSALERLLGRKCGADRPEKRRPRADFPEVGDGLRSIGIVQAKKRGLGEDVRGAETAGMERVALNLGGATFVTFDEQSGSDFIRSKQKTTVVFGSRVGVRVSDRVAVEGSFGYAPSKLKTDFNLTGIGSGTDETAGTVMLINGRLLLGFGPRAGNTSWHFIVGGGAIIRGGDAWSGVGGKTDIGGAVGVGARFKVGPTLAVRADIEDNLYSAKFDFSGTESSSKFQNDIAAAVGLAVSLGK